jgi:hypothetical protein
VTIAEAILTKIANRGDTELIPGGGAFEGKWFIGLDYSTVELTKEEFEYLLTLEEEPSE